MSLIPTAKTAVRVAVVSAAVLLSGCGMDDIQLNGKIFDAVGLNSTGSVKKEPTIAARAPLVVPPSTEQLPQPGSGAAQDAAGIAGVVDADARKQVSQSDLQRQQADYCRVHYDEAKMRGDNDADLAEGPLGPCRNSVFSAIKKWNSGDDDQE